MTTSRTHTHRARTSSAQTQAHQDTLRAALIGYAQQLEQIEQSMSEIRHRLTGQTKADSGHSMSKRDGRKLSKAGRARIAAAQKKRWAAARKAKAANERPGKQGKKRIHGVPSAARKAAAVKAPKRSHSKKLANKPADASTPAVEVA